MRLDRNETNAVGLAKTIVAGLLATGLAASLPEAARASSHREAPLITQTPKLDGTDFYMFRSYEPGRQNYVTLVANYIPLQNPGDGPNYYELDPDALYEIKIDNTGNGVPNITFQFHFQNTQKNIAVNVGNAKVAVPLVQVGQVGRGGDPNDTANLNVIESYSLSVTRGAFPFAHSQTVTDADTGSDRFIKPVDNIGEKTLPDYAAYAAHHVYNIRIPGCGLGRVFVGQRKDLFVVNLGETFDLVNIAHPVGEAFANSARDDLANKNVTSMVLEVPISCLVSKGPVIGGWTTASKILPGT